MSTEELYKEVSIETLRDDPDKGPTRFFTFLDSKVVYELTNGIVFTRGKNNSRISSLYTKTRLLNSDFIEEITKEEAEEILK